MSDKRVIKVGNSAVAYALLDVGTAFHYEVQVVGDTARPQQSQVYTDGPFPDALEAREAAVVRATLLAVELETGR